MPRAAWLATGAIIGALLLGSFLPGGAAPVVVVVACLGALGARLARRPAAIAVALGVAGVAIRLVVADPSSLPPNPPPAAAIEGEWHADVLTLGSTAEALQRTTLVVTQASGGGRVSSSEPLGPWRTYAWLPRYPTVIPGDRLVFEGRLVPVVADGSSFAEWLIETGVVATVRPRSMTLATGDDSPIAERVREAVDLAMARVVPEPMAGLASGILVGRRDRVSREVADSFTTTGLSHVVAISGWNICIVGAVVGGLLSATGLSRRSRTVGIVAALVAFTFIAGGGASVVRASVMGGVALIARESGRPGTATAALGIAVWLLLLGDPAMIQDIGFQLSVAATAGLLAWGGRMTERIAGPAAGRPRRWLAESLGVSLAAQAATLPLILFHFGRLSLVSPLANLLVAPIVAPAMLVGFIALVAGLLIAAGAPAIVGAPFALLGWLVLGAMVAIAGVMAAVPFASVDLGAASVVSAAATLCLVAGAAARTRRDPRVAPDPHHVPAASAMGTTTRILPTATSTRPRRALVVAGAIVLVVGAAGSLVTTTGPSGRLTVTVLDVGQGDAILVEGPRGTRMLLDSGPDPDRLITVLDRHVPPWDRRLDLVVLTHPHEDHSAGLATLLGRYRVEVVAENGMIGNGPGDAAFRGWLTGAGVATTRLASGASWRLDEVRADVRWPLTGDVPSRAPSAGRQVNDSSVVVDLRFGERRFLLTGDIEDDVDPRLLGAGIAAAGARLDVLKVAHHGSGTATSEAWLAALRPRVALVSAGTGNPYGHPAPSTIERLSTHGADVLRTDLDGDLQVSTDGHDLRVATSGGRPATATRGRARAIGGRLATRDIGTPAQPATPDAATSGRPASSAASAVGRTTTTVAAWSPWLCAIPLPPALLAARPASPGPRPARGDMVDPGPSRPPAAPDPHQRGPGDDRVACYDRPDDHPLPRDGRLAAALGVPTGGHRASLTGRGRCGGVARGACGTRGPPGGRVGDRDGGAAA